MNDRTPALGKLYLVPAPLDFGCATQSPITDVLPELTLRTAARLQHWVCENAKSTRAYLKRVGEHVPLSLPLQQQNLQLPEYFQGRFDFSAIGVGKYRLFIIVICALLTVGLQLILSKTRFGSRLRAAVDDPRVASGLGLNVNRIFMLTFAVGSGLAGLGGALQTPRLAASPHMDIAIITEAFVVTVVGGMGSLPGAFVAALLIAELKALCIWIGLVEVGGVALSFSKLTLVVEFVVMAVVLVWRPWGLMGKPQAPARAAGDTEAPLKAAGPAARTAWLALLAALVLLPMAAGAWPYATVLAADVLVAALFAASLHFLMGPAGLHSFGHAAYFGLGAYAAALLVRAAGLPMEAALLLAPLVAALGALVYGWFCVRLSGVSLTMLTLAFAQMLFFVAVGLKQYGGDEGLSIAKLSSFGALTGSKTALYLSVLAALAVALLLLRRVVASRFGLVLRATMINERRVNAVGTPPLGYRLVGYVVSALLCALAGFFLANLTSFASPAYMAWTVSGELIVMVLLGGMGTLMGPVVGALVFLLLEEGLKGLTDHWLAIMGPVIVLIVLFLKNGLWGILSDAPAARGGR